MILCFVLFIAAVVACVITGHAMSWAMAVGLTVFYLYGLRQGHRPRELWSMMKSKWGSAFIVLPILLLIGTITGLWRSSGTIAYFLYSGLNGIPPRLFLLVAFLLTGTLSFITGTCFGSVGTAGIVLIALAHSGGVDLAMTAGAVISGAYVGDRASPMASCASLVAACTETELYRNVKEMLKTSALPLILTALLYWVLSLFHPIQRLDDSVLHLLQDSFRFSPLVLLPALLMLVLPLVRVPVKYAMAASAVLAFGISVGYQGVPLSQALYITVFGFHPENSELAAILSGGGLLSMLNTVLTVLLTFLYAGLMEGLEVLSPIQERLEQISRKIGLFPTTALLSLVISAVFCSQSVLVMIEAQLLSDIYRRQGAVPTELAMDIANSGVVLTALIPWSIAISVPLGMMGVGLEAIPYSFLLYLLPICYFFTRPLFTPGLKK